MVEQSLLLPACISLSYIISVSWPIFSCLRALSGGWSLPWKENTGKCLLGATSCSRLKVVGALILQLPHCWLDNSEVHVLHWYHEFHSRVRLQLPSDNGYDHVFLIGCFLHPISLSFSPLWNLSITWTHSTDCHRLCYWWTINLDTWI